MFKKLLLTIIFMFFSFSYGQNDLYEVRTHLIDTLQTQLNVREKGYNRGVMVNIYLKEVGLRPGNPWCGAFVGSNLTWVGVKNPHSGLAADYAKKKDIIWTPKKRNGAKLLPGNVVTFYYTQLHRVGHVGFYEKTDVDGYFITIEGNTNGTGSREGDGVYRKKRNPKKVFAVSRYIK